MSTNNPFLRPLDFYQRRVNPIKDYIKYMGFYVGKMKNIPAYEASKKIAIKIKEKSLGMRNPRVIHFQRGDNDDEYKTATALSEYINSVATNNYVMAPTFTCYVSEKERPSQLVGYTTENKNKRKHHKKLAKLAKDMGDMLTYTIENNNQDNKKRNNNSLSGTFVADGTVLQNKTGHSTLTSITRLVSSLGNASNEKIIAGNRHYFNAEVTLNNLIYIAAECNKEEIEPVLTKYNLVIPTVDQVMECIKYSTDLYWDDPIYLNKIRDYVEKLDGCERAFIVYGGDLYHIRKFNPEFIRNFIDDISRKVEPETYPDRADMVKKMYSFDDQIPNYGHQICIGEMSGVGTDYTDDKKFDDKKLSTIWATCSNIHNTVEKYQDFIYALLLTNNIPASVANLPNSSRRSVVLSDTDSTMFSIDEWVEWYFGEIKFTPDAYAVAGAVMFVAVQCIAHVLAVFSANMNVDRSKINLLAMKPEYMFPAFALTSVAKHYYTCIRVKEGSVYSDIEMEIKGVHMKNSAVPKILNDQSAALMEKILREYMAGNKISLAETLKEVANVERKIFNSLMSGEVTYFKTSKIKNASSYTKEADKSPYQWHNFWQTVMAPKYGNIAEPPYSVVKIPTLCLNKTKMKEWIANIEDRELAARLENYCMLNSKDTIKTLYLSIDYLKAFGLPKEFAQILNAKKIVLDLSNTFRIILESLGYFAKKGMMVSELGY